MVRNSGCRCGTLVVATVIVFLGCVSIILIGYSERFEYEGDGAFTDSGPWKRTYNRYKLSLGTIFSDQTGTFTYNVGALPDDSLWWEFRITEVDEDRIYQDGYDSHIRSDLANMRLQIVDNESEEVIGEQSGPLSQWEWRNKSQKYNPDGTPWRSTEGKMKLNASIMPGMIFSPPYDSPTYGAFGFTPVPDHTYTVTVEVIEPDEVGLELRFACRGGLTWETP